MSKKSRLADADARGNSPDNVKFEHFPLFYPHGCAAPLPGIAAIATLERFGVYCSSELIISGRAPGRGAEGTGNCCYGSRVAGLAAVNDREGGLLAERGPASCSMFTRNGQGRGCGHAAAPNHQLHTDGMPQL